MQFFNDKDYLPKFVLYMLNLFVLLKLL